MIPIVKITKIMSVVPFKITALWNGEEVREIDFVPLLERWEKEQNLLFLQLVDEAKFQSVFVSETGTLAFSAVKIHHILNGQPHTSPLDFDPNMLYDESHLIKRIEPLRVGLLLKNSRKRYGLTQQEIADKSGTTRAYIARIEKGETDVQVDTLKRIVELGMGRKLKVQIED
jgi:DNA-binding XRE family transcriptional regulator